MRAFPIPPEEMVITSEYVTVDRMPIVYVSREYDEEEGEVWQFHCGNGDFSMGKMQIVRLSTILGFDASVLEVSDLPMGFCARRSHPDQPWVYARGE